jgi:tetratricopeptide (TPR) repeat protein
MSTAVLARPLDLGSLANRALNLATRFWFVVLLIGQLIFAFSVASFYGLTAWRGNFAVWNKVLAHGYLPGDRIGNLVLVAHIVSAVFIILAGLLQLLPQIRSRFPVFHRCIGRIYIGTGFSISLAGLYLLWVRGGVGDVSQYLGSSLMAVLIMMFAVLALRTAMARNFQAHRRWALRLYLTVSASLFIRAGVFLSILLNHGPFGFDPNTFTGPFLTFISFAQYAIPLAILEIYLYVQDHPGATKRFAMAAGLFLLTLGMGAGIAGVTVAAFVPNLKKAMDPRTSIAETLTTTIKANGVDQAVAQYHSLKSTSAKTYNFDEDELNALGYQLLKAHNTTQAIRIFQLNVEAYPNSSNTYDSLGEAFMDAGNKPQAIANYEKSLQLNPKNANGARMLAKLDGR